MPVPMKGGKLYATVIERLRSAHGDGAQPVGIAAIETQPISLPTVHGALIVVKATVTFKDGSVFTGLAEVPLDATSGAEKTNPVEVGETSAVGRALANAGYFGSDEGLAGAEEMREAQRRQNLPPRAARSGNGTHAQREFGKSEEGQNVGVELQKLRARYAALSEEAKPLGVTVHPIPDGATIDQLTDLGVDLKHRIQETKAAASRR